MKHSYLIAVLVAGLWASLSHGDGHGHHHHKESLDKKSAPAQSLSSESLYNSSSHWRSPEGQAIELGHFRGHNVILTMAYSSCQFSCPMTIAKLKAIEKDLKGKGLENYRIVIASFDPSRDTPDHLLNYLKEKNLSPSHWTFLSPASDKDVRELAALLGVAYSKDKNGEYSHANVIALLDSEGVLRERLNGVAADHSSLVARLVEKKHAH